MQALSYIISMKEHKGSTDINSPAGPHEAACMATLHTHLQRSRVTKSVKCVGGGEGRICYTLITNIRKRNYAGAKFVMFGFDTRYLSSLVLNVSIVLLLTTCAGREFQTFTILLKKKCFASSDRKCFPCIL